MQVFCESKKYDTNKLTKLLDRQATQAHSTGVTLLGVYQTKGGRVLVVTDSVWDNGRGECTGVTAHFADADEIARLAERYGGDLTDLVPEGE